MPRRLLLDVGGTFIKGAVVGTAPHDSIFLTEFQVPSCSAGTAAEIAAALRTAFARGGRTDALAVSIPGPFDFEHGIFRMEHKFAAVKGLSFRELLGLPADFPMVFMHDVNAQLQGELTAGAGQGCPNVALVTLGTGLGFSVAVDGIIRKALSGSPADSLWNLPCRDGILEDYVSSRGIRRLYGDELPVREIADRAREGDNAAQEAFATAGALLAEAVQPVLRDCRVGRLLIGGQIARSFDLLGPSLQDLPAVVTSLEKVLPVSDIAHAAFRGLASLHQPV